MSKSYRELSRLKTFEERFQYLMLKGVVGQKTFGSQRWENQRFYKNNLLWQEVKTEIILRDSGCDLGVLGFEIFDLIIVHHINPITLDDIKENASILYDKDNLVCTTLDTHNAIHYGNIKTLKQFKIVDRIPNDTTLWKKSK